MPTCWNWNSSNTHAYFNKTCNGKVLLAPWQNFWLEMEEEELGQLIMPWCWDVCFWWGMLWPDHCYSGCLEELAWWWKRNVPFSCHWASVLSHDLSLLHSDRCNVMLNQDTSVPGDPMGLAGGAISGSRAAALQHASFYKTKMLFKAKLDSLMKEGWKGGRGQLQRECHRKGYSLIWG